MLVSLCKMSSISVLKIFKNVLAQSVAFVMCFWKGKGSMLVVVHTMRGALSVAAVGRKNCFTFFGLVFHD